MSGRPLGGHPITVQFLTPSVELLARCVAFCKEPLVSRLLTVGTDRAGRLPQTPGLTLLQAHRWPSSRLRSGALTSLPVHSLCQVSLLIASYTTNGQFPKGSFLRIHSVM